MIDKTHSLCARATSILVDGTNQKTEKVNR